jgi:hypothetical protein
VKEPIAGIGPWKLDVSAARAFTLNPVPPLHSLQNLCPQLSQTWVNFRVRFPHLQHFRVTFHPPLWPLVLYQKRSYLLLAGNQHFGILPGSHGRDSVARQRT